MLKERLARRQQRSGGALPGQMNRHGRAAIRWEKALDVTTTEQGNVT